MRRYKINEIFYSLQGEGFFTGTPTIFIRFSGCNLQCPFCDTKHEEGSFMTTQEICAVSATWSTRHLVLTGGEPSLFVTKSLITQLHTIGKFVAVETNGTHPLPDNIDWITLSPKQPVRANDPLPILRRCNELKIVFTGGNLETYSHIEATHRYIQPCDTGDVQRNKELCLKAVQYCLAHPQWRLSLQTHKLLEIP